MSLGFIVSVMLRLALAWAGWRMSRPTCRGGEEVLPVYTILVPLYHEAGMVRRIAAAIAAIDYPLHKTDLKYVVEEDDHATRAALEAVAADEIIVVPAGGPRTKPKACNYALQFARGKYLVIYDAEDRPEPDQLHKAVAAFSASPDVSCFQARLSIGNGRRAWISRMFALDYSVWFRTLLPGLARLRAPIPLGGTSNHFRTADLVSAGAWDPFNVTEDADLGFRLARLGHRVAMLDSTTFDDAPVRWDAWLRQRSRWMKGYMQTVLVHTRDPLKLVRGIGLRDSLLIQAFLGGAVWSALVNPLLWVVFVAGLIVGARPSGSLDAVAWVSGMTLMAVNVVLALLSFAGVRGKGRLSDLIAAASYPLYWLFISVAAYRALWQLLRDPFRWEKTPHGVEECARC